VLSVESVGLPSVVMLGDRGETRCCGLSKVWNGRDGWNLSGDEITTHGYSVHTFVKCTTIMTAVLTVTSGLGSSFD
jgi:hypothetical protein